MLNWNQVGAIVAALILTATYQLAPNAQAVPSCSTGQAGTSTNASVSGDTHGATLTGRMVTDNSPVPEPCPTETPSGSGGGSSGGASPELTPEQLAAYLAVWLNSTYSSGMPNCASFSIDVAGYAGRCLTAGPAAPASPSATPAPGPTRQQAENLVINLIARLDIPDPQIQIGPEPSLNEWNMAVVGMPYWLWTTEATTKATSITIDPYTIAMTARRESVTFDPGDSTAAITCTDMQAWTKDNLMQTSPGCGHTFTQRNEKGVNYTMRARARWVIDWTALGYSGTLRLQTTATRSIHVGELQSVVVAVGKAASGG